MARPGTPGWLLDRRGFPLAFAVYTFVAAIVLLLGLAPALASIPAVRDVLDHWGAAGGRVGALAHLVLRANSFAEPPAIVALDYALSVLNIAVGVFLVMSRPRDWVTRLLGIGMVGTAVAFNIQTHGLFVAEIAPFDGLSRVQTSDVPFNLIHIAFHAISGAAYAHAFLLLPNGALIPHWLRWVVVVIYLVLLEEIAIPVAGVGIANAIRPGLLFGVFDDAFGVQVGSASMYPGGIVDAEVAFFVIFFGLLIPTAGLFAAFSRYRGLGAIQRAQTRLIVLTLVFSFAIGFIFIVVSAVALAVRGSSVVAADAENLRKLVFRVFPPLYAVIPPALVAAIVRYHFYDIDLLINRTVVYGSVTALLAATFAALSAAAHRALEQLTGERSDFVSIVVALGLVLGFGPLRKRVQPIVDRFLPGRGQLTLLFTDIVNSTSRVVELGDERWRKLLETYRATVRHELARFGGREIDTAGDGFFATFDRPLHGLHCAVALRGSLHALGLDSRIGLHAGECELRGERVSGMNVVVAARVMASAGANEVVVSDAVRELAVGSDFRFHERGMQTLKGVPGEWRLQSLDASELR
jgi:class 3 adenylate cyclase